jgi:type VI protein secretion system component VasF
MSDDRNVAKQPRIARRYIDHQWQEMHTQQKKLRRKMWIILFVAIVVFILGNVLLHSSSGVLPNAK